MDILTTRIDSSSMSFFFQWFFRNCLVRDTPFQSEKGMEDLFNSMAHYTTKTWVRIEEDSRQSRYLHFRETPNCFRNRQWLKNDIFTQGGRLHGQWLSALKVKLWFCRKFDYNDVPAFAHTYCIVISPDKYWGWSPRVSLIHWTK